MGENGWWYGILAYGYYKLLWIYVHNYVFTIKIEKFWSFWLQVMQSKQLLLKWLCIIFYITIYLFENNPKDECVCYPQNTIDFEKFLIKTGNIMRSRGSQVTAHVWLLWVRFATILQLLFKGCRIVSKIIEFFRKMMRNVKE